MLETVAEALARRDDCRYGLKGVRMRHMPTGRVFECGGSEWGADGGLLVYTRPDRMKPGYEKVGGGLVIYTLAELIEGTDPFRPDEIVRAEDCVCLSPWPVVCCDPAVLADPDPGSN